MSAPFFADHHTCRAGNGRRDPSFLPGGRFDDHPGHPGLGSSRLRKHLPPAPRSSSTGFAVFLPPEPAGNPRVLIECRPKPDRIDPSDPFYALSSRASSDDDRQNERKAFFDPLPGANRGPRVCMSRFMQCLGGAAPNWWPPIGGIEAVTSSW